MAVFSCHVLCGLRAFIKGDHLLCFMCWEVTDVSIHVTYRFKLDFELFKTDLFWNSSVHSSTVSNGDTVGKTH